MAVAYTPVHVSIPHFHKRITKSYANIACPHNMYVYYNFNTLCYRRTSPQVYQRSLSSTTLEPPARALHSLPPVRRDPRDARDVRDPRDRDLRDCAPARVDTDADTGNS